MIYIFSHKKENGSVLLLTLFMLLIMSLLAISQPGKRVAGYQAAIEKDTAVLMQAKRALLADAYVYSKAGVSGYRPGGFRCPDFNNDGVADGGRRCNHATLGRLPWKTLGIGELKDSSGQHLWYAISPEFKNHKPPFNSNSHAELRLNRLVNLVAVIIAPGTPINKQQANRRLNPLDPRLYLESINDTDHFSYRSIFSDEYPGNDRLVVISASEVIPHLEKIAMQSLAIEINGHYKKYGHYPWMARSDLDSESPGFNQAIVGLHSGRIPYSRLNNSSHSPQSVEIKQSWLIDMQWLQILLASVDETYTAAGINTCNYKCLYQIHATGELEPAALILLAPGSLLAGQHRPSQALLNYYEAENININNGVFRHGQSSQTFNDQLLSLWPPTGF